MPITVIFTPSSLNTRQYGQIMERLAAAGADAPKGRQFHVCFGDPNNLRVIDVWESQDLFDAFGQTLMPILQELGVDPGRPEIAPVHNVVEG